MNNFIKSKIKSTNLKEIFFKSFQSLLFRVLGYVLGYAFVLIITKNWNAEGQGYYAIVYMLLLLFTMLGKMGIDASLNKWCGIYNGNKNTSYLKKIYIKGLMLIFSFSIIVSVLIYLLRFKLINYFNDENLLEGIILISLLIPFLAILDYNSSFFRGLKNIKYFGFYNQIGKFLLPIITLLFLLTVGDNSFLTPVKALFGGVLFLSILSLIHVLYYLNKQEPNNNQETIAITNKRIITTAFPMMIASSIILLMNWIDTFILGGLDTKDNVGIYNVCVKLAVSISFIYNAMANITTPKIAEFYHTKNFEEIKKTIKFSNKINMLISFPIFLVLFIFSDFFLSLFGKEFVAGTTLLRVLLIYQMINVFLGSIAPFMQMTGSQKKLQYYILIALIVNIVFSVLCYQYFGMIGIALGTILATLTWKLLGAYYIYKNDNIKIWFN